MKKTELTNLIREIIQEVYGGWVNDDEINRTPISNQEKKIMIDQLQKAISIIQKSKKFGDLFAIKGVDIDDGLVTYDISLINKRPIRTPQDY